MEKRINNILADFGINQNDPDYLFFRDNMIEMRKLDYTYKQIEQWLEDKLN